MANSISLAESQTKVDAVVLKRLKFVFKIVKALTSQPNTRNRQAPVYIIEVLDAIGDWSGNPNAEITELLDKHMFPQICRLISTFSKAEFNYFQQFFGKYLLSRSGETLNFLVVDFLADMYGFVASIAPASVTNELVQVFQEEGLPPHVSLIVLPNVIRNIPDAVANGLPKKGERNLLFYMPKEKISSSYLKMFVQFWMNLKVAFSQAKNVYQRVPILQQCTLSSLHLELLEEKDILMVLNSLIEWGNSLQCAVNSEEFILVATIFLHSTVSTMTKNEECNNNAFIMSMKTLMERVVCLIEKCRNRRIRVFVMRVLQRLLEYYALENSIEVLSAFADININQINSMDSCGEDTQNVLFKALESTVKQISSGVNVNEIEKKKIIKVIDSLQTLLENSDQQHLC